MDETASVLKSNGLGAAALVIPGCKSELGRPTANALLGKPNIIFIMADDMGYGDVGFNWQVKDGQKVDFHRPLDWPMEYIVEVSEKIDYNKPIKEGPANTTNDQNIFLAFSPQQTRQCRYGSMGNLPALSTVEVVAHTDILIREIA